MLAKKYVPFVDYEDEDIDKINRNENIVTLIEQDLLEEHL